MPLSPLEDAAESLAGATAVEVDSDIDRRLEFGTRTKQNDILLAKRPIVDWFVHESPPSVCYAANLVRFDVMNLGEGAQGWDYNEKNAEDSPCVFKRSSCKRMFTDQ